MEKKKKKKGERQGSHCSCRSLDLQISKRKGLLSPGACSPLQVPAGQPARARSIGTSKSGTRSKRAKLNERGPLSKAGPCRETGGLWASELSHLAANERRPSDKTSTLTGSPSLDAVNPMTGSICRGPPTPIGLSLNLLDTPTIDQDAELPTG